MTSFSFQRFTACQMFRKIHVKLSMSWTYPIIQLGSVLCGYQSTPPTWGCLCFKGKWIFFIFFHFYCRRLSIYPNVLHFPSFVTASQLIKWYHPNVARPLLYLPLALLPLWLHVVAHQRVQSWLIISILWNNHNRYENHLSSCNLAHKNDNSFWTEANCTFNCFLRCFLSALILIHISK